MIIADDIHMRFGGIHAVDGVSMHIPKKSITGLIGPNGAGKSTLFNVIAGNIRPTSGSVFLDGEEVTGLKPHELFARGLLRTFQIAHEFPSLSVRENLMMVPGNQSGETLTNTWLRAGTVSVEEERIGAKADEVIEFIGISHLGNEYAGNLSGGQKKLLELGRTMMVEAKVVFLDEVGAGVNRTLLGTIGKAIRRLRDERDYTFCMIEHDMDFISDLCDPVIVMAEGQIIAEGSASDIMDNQLVIEAYLGTGLKKKATTESSVRSTHLEVE